MGSHQPFNTKACARFTVGRDHHGWWVVHDRENRVGGLFASEEAALHFARVECGRQPGAVTRAADSEVIELDAFTADHPAFAKAAPASHPLRPAA